MAKKKPGAPRKALDYRTATIILQCNKDRGSHFERAKPETPD
jgi:hypothetical protein